MNWQLDLIIVATFITAVIAGILAAMAWRRRTITGGLQLACLMLGVAIWSFFTALEFTASTLIVRTWLSRFEYFGVATVPVFYLIFALEYTNHPKWRKKENLLLMWLIPAATIILVFTNDFHHLIWTKFVTYPFGDSFLVEYGHGIGLWIATIYFYACMLFGFILVLINTVTHKGVYRYQGVMVLIGSIFPWIGNIVYMLNLSPIPGVDFSCIAFTISGLVLIWAVLRFNLLDLVPIARTAVVDMMQDGVIVLDSQGRFIDINSAACWIINKKASEVIGTPAKAVFSHWPPLPVLSSRIDELNLEIIAPDKPDMVIDLRISPLKDRKKNIHGYLMIMQDITRRKHAEDELARSENQLRRITDNMLDVIMEIDDQMQLSYISPSIKDLLGYTPDELVGHSIYEFVNPADHKELKNGMSTALIQLDRKTALVHEFRFKHANKGYIWLEVVTHYLKDDEGNFEGAIAVCRDITDRKRLYEAEKKAQKITEALRQVGLVLSSTLQLDQVSKLILEQANQVLSFDSASVLLVDENSMVILNTFGFPPDVELAGSHFSLNENNPNRVVSDTGAPYIVDDVQDKYEGFHAAHLKLIHSWMGIPLKYKSKMIGMLTFDSQDLNHFTQDDANIAVAFSVPVATAIVNSLLYAEMEHLATTDTLTGLLTRHQFFNLGEIEVDRALRYNRPLSLIMVDIDHFKNINDTYGHMIGDQVLRTLSAECFLSVLRKMDMAGRYGGEEFVFLLPETTLACAVSAAERIRKLVNNTVINSAYGPIQATVSLGVATLEKPTINVQQLIVTADKALYNAKEKGRNRVEFIENGDEIPYPDLIKPL
jgi:diguanylate cyclase (GGDEF)-like protein/PAS domain S-box-containing protein